MSQELDRAFVALRDKFIESRFDRLNDVQRQAVFSTEGPVSYTHLDSEIQGGNKDAGMAEIF